MGWRTAIVLASMALGGCNLSPFVCSDDSSCSQRGEGRCEANGACSYPDAECDSGRRYSAYGPSDEGSCVQDSDSSTTTEDEPTGTSSGGGVTSLDPSETTTGSTSESDTASTGEVPDACGGCSDRGSCVEVDGDPTCACDPGWTMVGLECLEDPCATETCYFVDSEEGTDDGPGTREQPWQTLGRAATFLGVANPGDHVLFRRGRTFLATASPVISAQGTSIAPIVVGAYGPPEDEPAPVFTNASLRLNGAEHVVLRDLSILGNGDAPCVFVENSGYFTLRDSELVGCGTRGIRVSNQSHHSVVFRNDIHDVGDKVGIYVADTEWTMPAPTIIGEHHWIAGNTVRNNGEFGIHALSKASDHERGDVGDFKIVGNQLSDTGDAGIMLVAPVAWVADNIIVSPNPAPSDYDGAIVVDNIRAWTHIRGNIVAGTAGALLLTGNGLIEQNSFFQVGGNASTVFIDWSVDDTGVVVDNLVFSSANAIHAGGDTGDLEELFQIDRNVYARLSEGMCTFAIDGDESDFADWTDTTGDELNSRCEVVPGLTPPPPSSVPVDDSFVASLAPGARWQGCDSVGAVTCDGQRRPLRFQPAPAVDGNGGRGWEGPLIIQQHYSLDR